MSDRVALLEAALESRAEGIALFDANCSLFFWNPAAEAITGFSKNEVSSERIPAALEALLQDAACEMNAPLTASRQTDERILVEARDKLGQDLQVIAEHKTLRDASGGPIGTAVFFHRAQTPDALPHGENSESECGEIETSQRELEERLQLEYDDFARGGPPFGVLWVNVDQAQNLRKTHGVSACHEMLNKVRRALAQGLHPAEVLGRWGDDEFLIIAHEHTAELLAAHAQKFVGLARTADFRWWGDRLTLTVSIGSAQACCDAEESLAQLLTRAQEAVTLSSQAGGNRATVAASAYAGTEAQEKSTCSPS